MLDDLYKNRMIEWQRLIDLYNMKFTKQIRDLNPEDLVKIARFYPIVRQIIASTSFNYPKLFFAIEEDEGTDLARILERASDVLLEQMNMKPHVHQIIFDALTCGVGWLRINYNPPGPDLISPYGATDANAEDLTSVSRVPPWHVHLDPQTPPHMLSGARYIREKLWIPLKTLKADDTIKNKHQIKPTSVGKQEDLGWGETIGNTVDDAEQKALRLSVENGEMVLCDRIHDKMERKQIMFAEGVEDEIQDIVHPFANMSFPEATDVFGQPVLDENGEPVVNLADGVSVPGWLVKSGFPFVPMKFDLESKNFIPTPHLAYLEDIQYLIVESMSRRATLLKRTSVQGVINESEVENNPTVLDTQRKGVDGEYHKMMDINNVKILEPPDIPTDQLRIEADAQNYEGEISRVNDLDQDGSTPITATQAAQIGAQISVNREWAQVAVSTVYTTTVEDCFRIMGNPRYTPENFIVNTAPNGEQALSRALTNADFLWNYRITVQAGSMQPLFEQIQGQKFMDFYDRAINRPNFDQVELDRMLANSVDIVDVEKVMKTDLNPEATVAAQNENNRLIQGEDPGVFEGQDHRVHIETHNQIQEAPEFQQLLQQAQVIGFDGQPVNQNAVQHLQLIIQVRDQHNAAHEQAMQQESDTVGAPQPQGQAQMGVDSVVRGNAQNVANAFQGAAQDINSGA